MSRTRIPWVDFGDGRIPRAWKVTRGCTKVSAGCANCWAKALHHRFEGLRGYGPWHDVHLLRDHVRDPLRWHPSTVFVCSESDLFHEAVPDGFLDQVFDVMRETPQHRYLLLTKRPWRMAIYAERARLIGWPENVWAGVTVESARTENRLYALLNTPAPVRFVSAEPLLGPISLPEGLHMSGLHWLIVGCESGPNARPMSEKWVRRLRDYCVRRAVPLYYKQQIDRLSGRKITHPALDGVQWKQVPV